jgi:hypothetical protein
MRFDFVLLVQLMGLLGYENLSPSGWQFIHYNVEASPNPWTMYV